MTMRRAFFDPITRLLKCHGFVETNEEGDIALSVPDDFSESPGSVRLAQDGVGLEQVPPPAPIDLSNVDNVEKALKALGLVVAQWNGKTPAQLKAAFKAAWDSLP